MTEEVAKVTVIVETSRTRRTLIYPRAYNVQFQERMPEPHVSGYRDGSMIRRPEQNWMETEFSMTNGKDENGNFRTLELEELDPIPDEIRQLVTKATQHNVNEVNRERLIKALTNLVENDRKENNK